MSHHVALRGLRFGVIVLAASLAFSDVRADAQVCSADKAGLRLLDTYLDPSAVEQAMLKSLQSTVEAASQGRTVQLEVVDLRTVPDSVSTLMVDGVGRMRIGSGGWFPLRFVGGYDAIDGRVFELRLRPLRGTPRAPGEQSDPATSERVGGQIAARILAEFPDQPTEVSFVDLHPIAESPHHFAFSGTGMVDFDAEGATPVDFSAIVDRATGLVVAVDYELRLAQGHGENEFADDAVAAR